MLITFMRAVRLLRSESLDSVGEAIGGFQKSAISTVERYPEQAGRKLRAALTDHYGASWRLLSTKVNGDKLASILAQSLQKV